MRKKRSGFVTEAAALFDLLNAVHVDTVKKPSISIVV